MTLEKITNKFEVFQKNYESAVNSIKLLMEDEDPETRHLVNWLYNTQHNPFGIFSDDGDAYRMSSADGFAGTCHAIHHALVDDGEICFPVVNGVPHIAFVDRYETPVEYLLNSSDRIRISAKETMRKSGLKATAEEEPVITWLKDAFEFTAAYDKYEEDCIRKHEEFERMLAEWKKEDPKP